MSEQINIRRIKAIHGALLEALGNDFVFVGGAGVFLYADREAEEARPTEDVDVLVEI